MSETSHILFALEQDTPSISLPADMPEFLQEVFIEKISKEFVDRLNERFNEFFDQNGQAVMVRGTTGEGRIRVEALTLKPISQEQVEALIGAIRPHIGDASEVSYSKVDAAMVLAQQDQAGAMRRDEIIALCKQLAEDITDPLSVTLKLRWPHPQVGPGSDEMAAGMFDFIRGLIESAMASVAGHPCFSTHDTVNEPEGAVMVMVLIIEAHGLDIQTFGELIESVQDSIPGLMNIITEEGIAQFG